MHGTVPAVSLLTCKLECRKCVHFDDQHQLCKRCIAHMCSLVRQHQYAMQSSNLDVKIPPIGHLSARKAKPGFFLMQFHSCSWVSRQIKLA